MAHAVRRTTLAGEIFSAEKRNEMNVEERPKGVTELEVSPADLEETPSN